MKKSSGRVAVTILLSVNILVLFIGIQGCNSGADLNKVIKFEFVDPLEKVLVEASYFPSKEAISEVIRGENATLQFVVRSQYSITDLRVNVSEARNGEKSLPAAKTGFVGYVKVGRSVWDYSRDRIVSISGYYPDPVLEQDSMNVDFGDTQPIWISIPVPVNAEKGEQEKTHDVPMMVSVLYHLPFRKRRRCFMKRRVRPCIKSVADYFTIISTRLMSNIRSCPARG